MKKRNNNKVKLTEKDGVTYVDVELDEKTKEEIEEWHKKLEEKYSSVWDISLCPNCNCMTKTIKNKCGKCKSQKKSIMETPYKKQNSSDTANSLICEKEEVSMTSFKEQKETDLVNCNPKLCPSVPSQEVIDEIIDEIVGNRNKGRKWNEDYTRFFIINAIKLTWEKCQENKLQSNHSNMVLNSNRETGSLDIEKAIKNVMDNYSEDFDEENFIKDMKKEFDFILNKEIKLVYQKAIKDILKLLDKELKGCEKEDDLSLFRDILDEYIEENKQLEGLE